jgi:hypothetical protein
VKEAAGGVEHGVRDRVSRRAAAHGICERDDAGKPKAFVAEALALRSRSADGDHDERPQPEQWS